MMITLIIVAIATFSCNPLPTPEPVSDSGVTKTVAKVQTGLVVIKLLGQKIFLNVINVIIFLVEHGLQVFIGLGPQWLLC